MPKITGDTPHDSPDNGNPLKMGVKALSALPTAVATADRADVPGDLFGRPRVVTNPATDLQTTTQTTSADASASAAAVSPAPGAGKYLCIDNVIVSVGATARVVTLTEETSGTVVAKLNMAVNSTATLGPLGRLATANKKLMWQTSGAGQVDITVVSRSE